MRVAAGVAILLIIFGTPSQTPTIIGLATAGLTVALKDFLVAFLGWFVLIGAMVCGWAIGWRSRAWAAR